MSTHTPETAHAALNLGILDMLMFSINPAYDYVRGEYGIGTVAADTICVRAFLIHPTDKPRGRPCLRRCR